MGVITQEQKFVCQQHNRQEYARISILNKQNMTLAQLEGKTIEGSINIDSSSYMRRSCSIKLLLDETTLPNKSNSLIFTDKRMKIEIGIKNILTNSIVWFPMGIYLFKSTQMSYSATDKTLSVSCLDLMANFSGDIGGTLENDVKLSSQTTPISEAIRSLVTQIGGEDLNNILIENFTDDNTGNTLTLPYTISKKAGDKILDAIKEMVELYKYWDCHYDVNGIFVAEHTKTLLSDPISEDFRDIDFTISSQVTNSFDYIKNYVKVYGISVQPMVSVEDVQSTDNPTPINSSTALKIIFNQPLYDSNGTRLITGQDVKSCFQYDGTIANYISATYNDSDWSVSFVITGENGKILKPISNKIYNAYQIAFDDGGYCYSTTDTKWSRILTATLITDGINNQIQFELNFNKPLYNASGVAIATGSDLKSAFTYSDGSGNTTNFLSAIYVIDSSDCYITISFANAVPNATIEINKDGTTNSNSVYDSAGLIYRSELYTMDGNTWTLVQDDSSLINTYQISAEASNTDNTSEYSIDNLGERRVLVVNDSNIYTKSQGRSRADYELQLHSNLNEVISLSCLSLYWLDVNMLIFLYQEDLGIDGKYVISKISYDLKGGTMSLTCNKVYF